jgi:hypothetical protein
MTITETEAKVDALVAESVVKESLTTAADGDA